MQLNNEIFIPLPVDATWDLLTDLERIAPLMPGARLTEIEGTEHRGTISIKVGPIVANYAGSARFTELDVDARRATLTAAGDDRKARSTASATIVATFVEEGSGTKVFLTTDLQVTGKLAQFGRGIMADISAQLIDEFSSRLASSAIPGGQGA